MQTSKPPSHQIKHQNNTWNKWVNELNAQFKKVQMANKYKKKCSKSLGIRKIQIKTPLRFHLTPDRMLIIKKTNKNSDKNMGEKDHS
jgi:hypothetical protein